MMHSTIPLKDVTQMRLSSANKVAPAKPSAAPLQITKPAAHQPVPQQQQPAARRYRHDPYNWNWRMPVAEPRLTMHVQLPQQSQPIMPLVLSPLMQQQSSFVMSQGASPLLSMSAAAASEGETFVPEGDAVCTALVQFKCHHGEFSSTFDLRKGQYVAVQGDRGMDVGVVIRINSDGANQYVERTGPTGPVMRYATQREVDYWATDLKADEAAALDYCKQRVLKHRLTMDVRHAEYQFDKKKLTFYYEAKSRVDFVTLLKELFREFSCRIWMEKIRTHE